MLNNFLMNEILLRTWILQQNSYNQWNDEPFNIYFKCSFENSKGVKSLDKYLCNY